MSTEDLSILPFDDFIHFKRLHEQPKKLKGDKKMHKYRPVYKGDGLLNKNLVVENSPSVQWSVTREIWDWNMYRQALKDLEKAKDDIDVSMEKGLNLGVLYSQGKKKRWELAEELKKEVPEIERNASSSSVVVLHKNRTGNETRLANNDPEIYDFWKRTTQLRGVNGPTTRHMKKILKYSYKTKNGDEGSGRGKFDPRIATIPQTDSEEPQLHIEYQILDYDLNEKMHNGFRRKTPIERKANRHPETEGCRLHYDVVLDVMGQWKTGDRERVGQKWRGHDDLPEENEEENVPTKIGSLTLGDFLLKELPKKGGRRKKSLSDSWDIV